MVNNRRGGEKKTTSECKWRLMFAVNVQTLSWHREDASGVPRESFLGVAWQKGEAFGPEALVAAPPPEELHLGWTGQQV